MKHSGFHRTIVAIAMMLIGWLPSLSNDFEVDGIFYDKLYSNKVAVTYKGENSYDYSDEYSGNVVIPSSVDYNGITYSVTSIGDYAFSECSSLTSIEIPNSVTSIGDYAFYYCSSLTSIEIPNSVTSIGDHAFYYCKSLTNIVIPDSVTSIGDYAFSWCESLISIVVDSGNTKYDSRNGCNAIIETASNTLIAGCKNTIIPNSVTSIGDWAFRSCSGLTGIEIPNSVTSIGGDAFSWCTSLTSIEIPNSVTSIGEGAFYYCKSLTSAVIGNGVTSIGNYAFEGCSGLTSIVVDAGNTKYDSRNECNAIIETASNTLIAGCQNTIIPNSVTSIGDRAFYDCSNLTSIQIPNSVTSIGKRAFEECSSLTSIEIPNSVTSIGDHAFYYCKSLTNIVIPNSVTNIGDSAFEYCSSLTSIQIPNSVTSIGDDAFSGCESLTRIEIPNSVTSIGDSAFEYCSSLTSIQIPNSVTSIGDWAFSDCSSLTSIVVDAGNSIYDSRNECNAIIETASNTLIAGCQNTIIPNSVTSIGRGAFCGCESLTSIQIPYSVTSIGKRAFEECSSLTKITCSATNPPTIESSTFSNYSAELYVPAGCKAAYQSAYYWKNFNIKEFPIIFSTSIALNKTSASLKATETLTLVATVLPENATDKSVTWKSSNKAVATVDANGKVTAVAVGEATITATTADGSYKSATCKITVAKTLATSISLDKTSATLKATETLTLKATVAPATTTDKSVTWKSSNEAVATVDANGKVTAVAVGEATITAITADGSDLSASCNVTVVPTLAETITLDKTEISLEATETATLIATVLPELTTDKSVKWSSSDVLVAVVDDNGVVTAIAVGEATITATTADGSNLSASCKVTVVPTLAEAIALDKTEISLEATETATLIATILPELTTDKSVEWSSSDETVAVVDKNGVVTAVAVGEATITATTADGSNKSATCKVTVTSTLATSITLNHTEYEMVEKAEFQLSATILPESTKNKGVVWSSSDMWIASVDENGLVRAYSVGEAVITATTIDGSNKSATCKVIVVPTLATSITLDYTEYQMVEKSDFQLTATILPESTKNKGVVWSSSDMWIASVDENGLVRAYSVGEAIITATTVDGSNLSASCKVTVVSSLAQSITLDKTEVSLEVTETAALVATVLPELTTNKSVKWSSSNETVAVVDKNGVVTAISIGEAVITATTVDDSNLSASCKVTVIPTLAVSIELDQTEASVEEKSEFQLTATILPEHTTNKEVAWSSSKKVIATVDETGLVFVKSVGEVIITATTTDGTNLSAACHINVYSGIDGVNGDDVIVATVGDNIVVKNAKIDSIVRVYAADGSIISSEVATDGDVVVEAPIKGVYIVSVNGKTFKVMVK